MDLGLEDECRSGRLYWLYSGSKLAMVLRIDGVNGTELGCTALDKFCCGSAGRRNHCLTGGLKMVLGGKEKWGIDHVR